MVSTSAIISLFLCVATCQALGFTTPMKAKRRQGSQVAEWFDFKPVHGDSGVEALNEQVKHQQKSVGIREGSKWEMNSKANDEIVKVDEFVTVKIEGKATELEKLKPVFLQISFE